MEDAELVQTVSQGDLNAFNELVLKYQNQVFNLARRILENQDMAEDITQDAFIHTFQKIHQFRGDSFRAWLLKITTNLCYDEMRAWKRHSHQALEPINKEGQTNETPYWLKDPSSLPEEKVETSELLRMLENELSRLPLKFRVVVTLVDIYQMNYKEAASVMNISIGTVKSRLARGRMQFRKILNGLNPQEVSEQNTFDRGSDHVTAWII